MNLVFIIGTGRCGSTLVHEIIARHENVGFVSNIDDNLPALNLMGQLNNAIYRSPIGQWTRKGGFRFAPSEAYQLISRQVSPIYANSTRDLYAQDVTPWLERCFRDFFENRHTRQGRPLFLHKYTGWSRIGFFARIFPEAKFIHIVRDGRAVANSWLQMPWWNGYQGPENWLWGDLPESYRYEWLKNGRSFTSLAGIAWKMLMDSYEKAKVILPESNYLELRYEDFLKSPRDICKVMLDFSGLEWSREFERSFARQKIFASRSKAYERDLSIAQLDELRLSLESHLVRYNYA